MILERNGYGSNFNTIEILDNILIKKSNNNYGLERIKIEINFYEYLIKNSIHFDIPKIINYDNQKGEIIMEYLNNYTPLYKHFILLNNDEKIELLNYIFLKLKNIHNIKINVDRNTYINDLIKETNTKIIKRNLDIQYILKKYDFIKRVNGVYLKSLEEIVSKIKKIIDKHIETKNEYVYNLIHGDCQFNNILINDKKNDIKFIDPRGYYGDTLLFGIKEYDIAKINFALSGYDLFDNMDIKKLDIDNDNLIIIDDILNNNNSVLTSDKFILALVCSIWLGNAEIFKDNELKCIFSNKISLYFGTKYLF